jgi:hydrophobic/amphiphilic exporter-1 (mainly G- bacteria), HAE1 family
MSIAHGAVTRPVAVTMRIAAFVLLGAVCLMRLPVDLLPKVSLPTVAVITTWPDVASEEIESEVTRPIEEAVSAATNLYEVDSSTTEGSSVIRVQFQWGTDIGQAAVDVLHLVERARQAFPTDPTLETPIVFRFDPTQLPILILSVSGERDSVKRRTLLENQVDPIIESANGVASAAVTGGEQRAVIVDVDPVRMLAHHTNLATVAKRIADENINLPAGIARQGQTEYVIRSLGWMVTPQEVAQIPLGTFNGQIVTLGQVADVRDSHPETRLYTRFNQQPCVGVIITKQSGANTVDTAQAVFDRLERVKRIYPNLEFGVAYNQAQ